MCCPSPSACWAHQAGKRTDAHTGIYPLRFRDLGHLSWKTNAPNKEVSGVDYPTHSHCVSYHGGQQYLVYTIHTYKRPDTLMPGYFHPVAFCCVTAPAASLESLSLGALAICGPGCILHGSRPRPLSGPPEPYRGKGKKEREEEEKRKNPTLRWRSGKLICVGMHIRNRTLAGLPGIWYAS
jgi:hypothetical protein